MKKFEIPQIKISEFDINIVTTGSGEQLTQGMQGVAGGENFALSNAYNITYNDLW